MHYLSTSDEKELVGKLAIIWSEAVTADNAMSLLGRHWDNPDYSNMAHPNTEIVVLKNGELLTSAIIKSRKVSVYTALNGLGWDETNPRLKYLPIFFEHGVNFNLGDDELNGALLDAMKGEAKALDAEIDSSIALHKSRTDKRRNELKAKAEKRVAEAKAAYEKAMKDAESI